MSTRVQRARVEGGRAGMLKVTPLSRRRGHEIHQDRVDAPGFEPGASPLQGERSTADLRAPVEGDARFALSYFNDSSQALLRADGLRCLLHSVNASPQAQ